MIIKDKTNIKVEVSKAILGLSGDVYITENHRIESLDSHKRLLASYGVESQANTIEEAESEREQFEIDLSERITLEDALAMLRELGVDLDE